MALDTGPLTHDALLILAVESTRVPETLVVRHISRPQLSGRSWAKILGDEHGMDTLVVGVSHFVSCAAAEV